MIPKQKGTTKDERDARSKTKRLNRGSRTQEYKKLFLARRLNQNCISWPLFLADILYKMTSKLFVFLFFSSFFSKTSFYP